MNLFLVTELIIAEPVSGAPIITPRDASKPNCDGLSCTPGDHFCDPCCISKGHNSGSCEKPGNFFVCKCKD